jgi:ketosteroid isomerase-like protein
LTSQENVQALMQAWAQWLETGEFSHEQVHEDAEIHWNPQIPDARVYHGPKGLAEALQDWQDAWGETEYEFLEVTDAGDHVLVGLHERGKGKGSGVEVDWIWYQVYTFRDGKLAMLREFTERDEAAAAAGLDRPLTRARRRIRSLVARER